MALTNTQRLILTGVGVGIVIGVVMGVVGGLLGLPAGVRGGITGALIVVTFYVLRKQMAANQGSAAGDRT
jgi:hypothetical protein